MLGRLLRKLEKSISFLRCADCFTQQPYQVQHLVLHRPPHPHKVQRLILRLRLFNFETLIAFLRGAKCFTNCLAKYNPQCCIDSYCDLHILRPSPLYPLLLPPPITASPHALFHPSCYVLTAAASSSAVNVVFGRLICRLFKEVFDN